MNVTKQLSEAIAAQTYGDLPADVVAEAKLCLIDWLGVTLGGSGEPLTKILIEVTGTLGGEEQATVIGHGFKDSLLNAALINGSASHALDFDDVHFQMMGHPTVPVMPALLALAEERRASGRDFLNAFVVGFETECRIGSSMLPFHYQQGWHATATIGRLGAAAACAKLLKLDSGRINHALGLGGTQAGGLKQVFGTMAKPFHAGKAAMDGLLAALLAEKGFTCSDDILAGEMGFCRVLSPEANVEVIPDGFGENFTIMNVIFKRHASCFETHPTIDAALSLHGEIRTEEIEEVLIEATPVALEIAGKAEPRTGLEGKFSLAYCAALALADGETGEERFTDANVQSERLSSLWKKATARANEDLGLTQAEITVRMTDGRELRSRGDTFELNTDRDRRKADLIRKFRSFADRLLPAGRADAILEFVAGLEEKRDISEMLTFFEA